MSPAQISDLTGQNTEVPRSGRPSLVRCRLTASTTRFGRPLTFQAGGARALQKTGERKSAHSRGSDADKQPRTEWSGADCHLFSESGEPEFYFGADRKHAHLPPAEPQLGTERSGTSFILRTCSLVRSPLSCGSRLRWAYFQAVCGRQVRGRSGSWRAKTSITETRDALASGFATGS